MRIKLKPRKGDYNISEKMVRIYVSVFFFFYFIISSFHFLFFDAYREIFYVADVAMHWETNATEAEADLSSPVMLWCIIPKWMVNGLCNLHGVKAFFLEIVVGIRSIASILPAVHRSRL